MPTLRYVGPIDEVDVVGVGVLKHGDEVEVGPDYVDSLLALSDCFVSVESPAPAKKKGDA